MTHNGVARILRRAFIVVSSADDRPRQRWHEPIPFMPLVYHRSTVLYSALGSSRSLNAPTRAWRREVEEMSLRRWWLASCVCSCMPLLASDASLIRQRADCERCTCWFKLVLMLSMASL